MSTVVASNLVTTLSPSPDPTQSYYERQLLLRAKPKNYHARWADNVALGQKRGKTVIMRRYAFLALANSPLAEGVPPAGKTPTLTDYSAALNQFGDFIALSDFADMTGIDEYQTHWAGLLGDQAGYTIDTVDRDVLVAGTNVVYANGTQRTHVNTTIDANDLDRATRFLINNATETILGGNSGSDTVNSYPMAPAFVAIVHPYVYFDLRNITGFRDASELKGCAPDEVGRYKNIAFFIAPDVGNSIGSALNSGAKVYADGGGTASGMVYSTTGTSADVYVTQIFGKHYFCDVPLNAGSTKMYRKPLGSAGTSDPLDQIMTMGWKQTSARLRTNENWGVRIESAASI